MRKYILFGVVPLSCTLLTLAHFRSQIESLEREYLQVQEFCRNFSPPSVFTFAGTNLRPGAYPSCLSGRWTKVSAHKVLPAANGTLTSMPLFLNAKGGEWPSFLQGKEILVFQTGKGLVFVDRLNHSTLLEAPWPNGAGGQLNPHSSSTPVFDQETYSLYGGIITGKGKNRNWAYRYSLKSRKWEWRALKLSKKLSSSLAARKILDDLLICRTAWGLQRSGGKSYLFGGCSFDRYLQGAFRSTTPGVRAGVFLWELGARGEFGEMKVFTPSKVSSEGKEEGTDGGVWHAGAGPSVLPDGTLLLASGNGVFQPDRGNFGCSVVRINDEMKALGYLFRPSELEGRDPSGHCDHSDLDISSSSIASVAHNGKVYSAILGKDGILKSFDPFELPRLRSEARLTDQWIFGQPMIWFDGKNIQLRAVSNQNHGTWAMHSFLVRSDHTLQLLWKKEFPGVLPNTSASLGYNGARADQGVVAVPVWTIKKEDSHLFLVDAQTGEELGRVPFQQSSHFSMPLVVGKEVYLTNRQEEAYEVALALSYAEGRRKISAAEPVLGWFWDLLRPM